MCNAVQYLYITTCLCLLIKDSKYVKFSVIHTIIELGLLFIVF